MSVEITMPKLSDTMEEGKILRWLKKPGDAVAKGDVLAEVETDKADMELEAEASGVLAKVLVEEGGSVAVGQPIAVLGDAGAEATARAPQAKRPQAKTSVAERGKDEGAEAEGEEERAVTTPPPPSAMRRPAREAVPPPRPERRPDLAAVRASASGPRPVERSARRETVPPGPRPVSPPVPPRPESTEKSRHAAVPAAARASGREPLSRIRKTVARRMAESKREVPHFYMTVELEMTEAVRLKEALAKARPDAPAPSYTHLLLRAVTIALGRHPRINARFAEGDAVEFSEGVHLGIAVALDEGLIVPVLHNCESKDVFTIAAETRELVERVREGKAQGADLQGGTFTVSNLGMYPIDEFAAVINPPQAAVLAVGTVRERPIVKNGAVVAAPTMRVTLSSDHRVIDGAEAAQFLQTLRELVESGVSLVL